MNIFFEHIRLRRITTVLALALLLFVAGATMVLGDEADPTEPLLLRSQIETQGAFLRFVDVFSNAGALSQTVLTRAPDPGRRVSLDPSWLSAKAAAQGRIWQNLSGLKRVTVRRAGQRIGTEHLRTLIGEELGSRADGVHYEITLSNRAQTLFIPMDAKGVPEIISLDMMAQGGVFTARIAPYESAVAIEIRGRAWALVQVPALSRSYRADEAIAPEDVKWIDVRETNLRAGVLMDPDSFTGKVARRALRAGKPLKFSDLKRLAAVKKGEIITITYQVPGIRLTSQGRSLGEAALGEPLRVVNLQSSRTIDVVVTAPGKATANIGTAIGG